MDRDPLLDDPVVSAWVGQGVAQQGRVKAATEIDPNPEQAAKDLDISKRAGIPYDVVKPDSATIQDQLVRRDNAKALEQYPELARWVARNPGASEVSYDDMPALGEFAGAMKKLGQTGYGQMAQSYLSIMGRAFEGFKEGFGDQPVGAAAVPPGDIEWAMASIPHRIAAATWMAAYSAPEFGMRALSGATSALSAGVAEGVHQVTGSPDAVEQGRQFARFIMDPGLWASIGIPVGVNPAEAVAHNAAIGDAIRRLEPYARAGEEPPPGAHPLTDLAHVEQNKLDLKNLDEALRLAQATQTRERHPEILAALIREFPDARIGVSADAVRALYGEKAPEATDSLLGWVPDIVSQLRASEEIGGDVEIPLADWLAKVDPKVAEALHDDIRVRPGGVTAREGEVLSRRAQAPPERIVGAATRLGDKVYSAPTHLQAAEQIATELGQSIGQFIEGDWKKYEDGFLTSTGRFVSREEAYQIADVQNQLKSRGYPSLIAEDLKPAGEPIGVVRQAAGLEAMLKRPADWLDLGGGMQVRPKLFYTENEDRLAKIVGEEANRLIPQGVSVRPVAAIEIGGRWQQGVYDWETGPIPLILWSLQSRDPIGTIRHEAMHHLYRYGFFSDAEWGTLEQAAKDNDWISKYDIDKRYAGEPAHVQLEEAIAEHFAEWRKAPETESTLGKVFGKIQQLLDTIKSRIQELLGKEPTWEDLFEKADTGEIGRRKDFIPEAPHGPRLRQEPNLFEKAVMKGMTADQFKRYQKLIAARDVEDLERAQGKAEADAKQRLTPEWKENEARVRDEVAAEMGNRPDHAADQFLRRGLLYSQKMAANPKLDARELTEQQKAVLHPSTYAKTGLKPDDVAGLFGFSSGDAMINRLGVLEMYRKQADLEPAEFFKKSIDDETERRMQKQYGDLNENILKEAREHAISPTQLDMMHEETLALGTAAGAEMPIKKGDLGKWVKERFAEAPIKDQTSKKYLDLAGKAWRDLETALLKDDPKEAFRQAQRREIAMLMANEAKKYERERTQFDKLAKQMSKREVPSVDQEYTNFVHDILSRIGQPIRRSVQDLQKSIGGQSLEQFVADKESALREVPVAEFLLDPGWRKSLNDLTVDQFRAVRDSIKALVTNGRDELKIIKAGEAADLNVVKQEMIDQIQTLPKKEVEAPPYKRGFKHAVKTAWASLLQMEALFNRWDRGNPGGVYSQYVMRPLAEAANYEAALERKYGKLLRGIADKVDLSKKVDNWVFMYPGTQTPIPFTRGHLRAVLQNVGNASNMDKLARGYGVKPERIMNWLNTVATKEDWNWAQSQGDIFAKIKREADTMYRGLSGIAPEDIPIENIATAQGVYRGWYHPVVYDPILEGPSKKLMGRDPLEQDNYTRATTPRGYTKQRTGYAAPLSLDLSETPSRMRSMLHDIAFRPAVINASKIFYDKDVRAAIRDHYGSIYRDMLVPYLRDVANSANFRSDAQATGARVSEFLRQNIIGTLIGFNPGTVMKHGPTAAMNSMTEVGPVNFLKAVKDLLQTNDVTGDTNWRFAVKTSEELQRRHRNYVETLRGAQQEVLGETSIREFMLMAGATPVAISDMLSAVPTWLAKYRTVMEDTGVHGSAVYEADRAVRRAHGSVVITNRPAAMRGGQMAQWMTSLYGFFSHMLNRQFELTWKASDSVEGLKKGDFEAATKHLPDIAAGFFSYIIFPAVIEELVTPMTNDQHESWGKWAATTLAKGVSSSWPIVRDLADFALSHHRREPSVGLFSATAKSVTDVTRDLSKGRETFTQHNAGNLIQHFITAFGALSGLTNAQEGKTAKFLYNYATGQEHPRGAGGWWRGLRYGTSKERK